MLEALSPSSRKLVEGRLGSPALAMSSGPCIYAIWLKESALKETSPQLPESGFSHDGWHVIYIGFAPHSLNVENPRLDRVISNQFYGSLASSSFMVTMAALLIDHLKLVPIKNGKYAKIETTRPLREWLLKNCKYTIIDTHQPTIDGPLAIEEIKPIMSIRRGKTEFRREIDRVRRDFLEKCGVQRVVSLR